MFIKAESKFLRTTPRKLRLVADLIRPMTPVEALVVLKHTPKAAATALLKTLKQAVANSVNNHNLSQDNLIFKTIEINPGPSYKRFQAVSKGRAHAILKRTSHIKIVLEAKETKPKPKTTTRAKALRVKSASVAKKGK